MRSIVHILKLQHWTSPRKYMYYNDERNIYFLVLVTGQTATNYYEPIPAPIRLTFEAAHCNRRCCCDGTFCSHENKRCCPKAQPCKSRPMRGLGPGLTIEALALIPPMAFQFLLSTMDTQRTETAEMRNSPSKLHVTALWSLVTCNVYEAENQRDRGLSDSG